MTYRNTKPRDPGAILIPGRQGPGPREQHLSVDKWAPRLSCVPWVGVPNGTRFERDFKSFELQVLGGRERKQADTLLSAWAAAGPTEPERGRCTCPGQAAINRLRPKGTGLGREARLSSQAPDLATEISPQRIKPALCLGLWTQDVKEGRGWGQGVLPQDHACRGTVPLPHTQR